MGHALFIRLFIYSITAAWAVDREFVYIVGPAGREGCKNIVFFNAESTLSAQNASVGRIRKRVGQIAMNTKSTLSAQNASVRRVRKHLGQIAMQKHCVFQRKVDVECSECERQTNS